MADTKQINWESLNGAWYPLFVLRKVKHIGKIPNQDRKWPFDDKLVIALYEWRWWLKFIWQWPWQNTIRKNPCTYHLCTAQGRCQLHFFVIELALAWNCPPSWKKFSFSELASHNINYIRAEYRQFPDQKKKKKAGKKKQKSWPAK